VRVYVTAIEGCNHVCSFCVVPRTRGAEVCRDPDAIAEEVRSLVGRGYPEVMLLGQTVNAYPEHVDERMARALRDLPRVCPYLHLPVQSGADRILSAMRRGYTRAQYLETVALLRAHVPALALTTDVIVGYPGETESEFEATVSLVEEVAFDGVFVFMYSPRPGTAAVRLTDDVPADEKLRRLQVINSMQQRAQELMNRARI